MSLKDLIVQKKHITEELLESVLKKHAQLIAEEREVALLPSADPLIIKQKVLLYLAGIRAWDFVEAKPAPTPVKNSQIEKALKIEGNTLRPILKSFRDNGFVEGGDEGSIITYAGVESLENIDEGKQLTIESKIDKPETKNTIVSKVTPSGREDITSQLQSSSLDMKYVEKILDIVRNVKNIDKYLLTLYIAKTEFGIDGLTPGEINLFLTNPPFKLQKMFTTNVSRDLGKNFKTKAWVNPYESAGKHGLVYRLTSKGEKRVDELFR
jgi:hypothetical protein